MEKIVAAVQIGGLTQRYDLPDWAQDAITTLGGPGFVVRDEQFGWYDYVVKMEFYGCRGMKRQDVENLIKSADVLREARAVPL